MPANHIYQFGLFRIDTQGPLLFRAGERISLTPKAAEILVLLIEGRGRILSKEELLEKVWPDCTVEEGNLTSNISLLRRTLGNSDTDVPYIETIPKRGYRFLAPVQVIEDPVGAAELVSSPEAESARIMAPTPPGDAGLERVGPRPVGVSGDSTSSLHWKILAPLAVILGVLAMGTYHYYHRPPMLTEKDTIVLAEFDNKTGDSAFEDTLGQALTVSLRQSPYLNVLSEAKSEAILRMMTLAPETRLTPGIVRELCQRANGKVYVSGSLAAMGSRYVIGLRAVDCASGDVLVQEQTVAEGKEKVLDALGQAASRMRTKLGESLPSVQKFDAPLSQETTPSLAALKAFSLGLRTEREKGTLAALPFYQRAIELDPNFARAMQSAGVAYSNLGQADRANEYLTRAFHQRDHASEWEKLNITAGYYLNGSGDLDKAAEALREWEESYPRDDIPAGNLGYLYCERGQWQLALEETQRSLQLDTDSVISYENLAQILLALGRNDEARKTYMDARARKLDDVGLRVDRYALAFLESDSKVMGEQAAWFADKPEVADEIFALEQETEAYAGHRQKARELTRRAVDSAVRADNRASAAIWELEGAYREEIFGEADAREHAIAAIKLAPESSEAEEFAAFVLAGSGDSDRAESLMRDLQKHFPSRTMLRFYWLPITRAQIALVKGRPMDAIKTLEEARPVELGLPLATQSPPCLYPVYVRGEAYLAAGQGMEAAAEFHKLIDHRGIAWGCATGVLAHVGLARGYALQGDTAKARNAYQDFFALWKDADPDIPVLKQAKSEYAKLQ